MPAASARAVTIVPMASLRTAQRARRLACPNFGADEITALRSMFSLLKPYLKQEWEIVDGEDADLLIVNLDAGAPSPVAGTVRVVGCAHKPRQHGRGILHRPLRAAELLALLGEIGGPAHEAPAGGASAHSPGLALPHHRLLGWPAEFEQWPLPCQRVLAAISRGARSQASIVDLVGASADQVADCLGRLQARGLLETTLVHLPPVNVPQPSPGRWVGLAARVGALLGFAR